MLKTIVFIIPLALDTFAVSAAIGVAGLPDHQRLRVSAIFAGFEMVMPPVGFAVGRALGGAVGGLADYLAIAILVAVGVTMLRTDADKAAIARAASNTHGAAILGLGLSISLDELAIGFTIGLSRACVSGLGRSRSWRRPWAWSSPLCRTTCGCFATCGWSSATGAVTR